MQTTPDHRQQIIIAHAGLIQRVVMAVHNPSLSPGLEPVLRTSQDNGWEALVKTIRAILAGRRDEALLAGLDEEDRVITETILAGLQDPNNLKALDQPIPASAAAPGLAGMIAASAAGDAQTLQLLAQMGEQMTQAGGDMARLGGNLRRLINGERDVDLLTHGMGAQGEQLMRSLLQELARLAQH